MAGKNAWTVVKKINAKTVHFFVKLEVQFRVAAWLAEFLFHVLLTTIIIMLV